MVDFVKEFADVQVNDPIVFTGVLYDRFDALPPCRAAAYASTTSLKLTGTVFSTFTFISNHALAGCYHGVKLQ